MVKQQAQVALSTCIVQVGCVSMGTMVLTDNGEVYYCGDSRYGQIPIEEANELEEFKEVEETQLFKLISMPCRKMVTKIAAGGDHMFAITNEERVYGWGRNSSAQLGIGFQQESISTPTPVPAFHEEVVTKLVCGPNYSAAITTSGRLMVTGSMEYGKLGLGPNMRSGFIQEFTCVNKLRSVIDVACGPTHMLAIVNARAT